MTASGTVGFFYLCLPRCGSACSSSRKETNKGKTDAGVLWDTTASFKLMSLFASNISARARRELELSECFSSYLVLLDGKVAYS